jgi:hypothetical protein
LTDASQAAVEGRRLDNVSALYAQRAAASGVGHVRDLERGQVAHPIDSHPPLADRLENLGLTFDDTLARAQRAVPDAASELFGDLETLEGRLTELLGGWAGEAIGLRAADEANGLSSGELTSELRDAATTDPAVARLITLFEPHRGPALARPFRPAERWIALADLRLEQHPDPRPFIPTVPMAELPEGDQLLVVDVAGNETDRARVLFARAELVPVGFSPLEDRRQGYEEHFYDWQGRLVVVRGVGKWPVEHQLAGLFVAPSSDPIVAVSGPFAADVEAARSALADRRGAEAPS